MKKPPFIFIVDDDTYFLEIISMKLKKEGYRVASACNGAEAIAKLKQMDEKPVLILLDFRMPVMTGPETLLKMRETKELEHIEALFITQIGANDYETKKKNSEYAKKVGALGYAYKGSDLNEIVAAVRDAILVAEKNGVGRLLELKVRDF